MLAFFCRGNVPESDKGRPGIVPVAAGVGGTLAVSDPLGRGLLPAHAASVSLTEHLVLYGIIDAQLTEYFDSQLAAPATCHSMQMPLAFRGVARMQV